MSTSEILVGQYLFRRLKELGIKTVFGVPGDFELALLDLVEPEGLNWIGTPNELIGAYAADGYARHKDAGALVTTFGPGELSALCGIGGSFCENVPVVHIVGYPTTAAQKSGRLLHHTLGDGSYEHYIKISSELSCATAVLKDPVTAVGEIDRVLNAMMHHSQPVYIGISEDVAYHKVSTHYLETKLTTSLPPAAPASEETALQAIMATLESAQAPILIVDGGAARQDWEQHVEALIDALRIPVFTTVLGKGVVHEESAQFHGVYSGVGSPAHVTEAVAAADVILWLGNRPSDFNTGMFTEHVENSSIVDFQRFSTKIGDKVYDARINSLLPKLIQAAKAHAQFPQLNVNSPPEYSKELPAALEQDWLWRRLSSFIQPGDLIVTETGTAQLGVINTSIPKGAKAWTQAVYGSIGYAAGAAVGASIAAKETGQFRRMVVITGEGSLQLTVQAFALLNRHGIVPVVLVLNNSGYTVERFFCGMTASYNDVPDWKYGDLFQAFSPEVQTKTYKVAKAAELDQLLSDREFNTATYPQCVEIILGKFDLPTGLKTTFESRTQAKRS